MQNLCRCREVIGCAVDQHLICGAAAALVSGGHVEELHVGSSAMVPLSKPAQEGDIYDLASLTKVVGCVTGCLWCMERGLFDLDCTVTSLLPWFPHKNVTVRRLLTHTAGLAADDKAFRRCITREQQQAFLANLPLLSSPGERVVYSDLGFILLGLVIEAASEPIDKLLQSEIFGPLGMKDTGYRPDERGLAHRCVPTEVTEERGVIKGSVHDSKAFVMGGVSGHAGLFSTAADLAVFAQMLLSGGYNVLKEETVQMLQTCYTQNLNARRTLGWLTDERGRLYHTGFTGTSMSIDFANNQAVILLTNAVHPKRGKDLSALRCALHAWNA